MFQFADGKLRLKSKCAIAGVVGLPKLYCDHPVTLLTTQRVLNEDTGSGPGLARLP